MKKSVVGMTDKERLASLAGITMTEDEHLLSYARIHGAIYWKGVAVVILGLLLLPTFAQNVGFLLMFVGGVMIGLAYLTRFYLILAASDKRIFIRSGILYADMIEMRYGQIEGIELGITPIGQIFGYGSVIITGTGQRRVIVPFISDAVGFRRKINEVLVNK
jgi:hypothetical protein